MKTSKNSKTNNKSKTKKGIVDRYYCELYDTYLYVANRDATLSQIRKYVKQPDGEEIDESIYNYAAVTVSILDDKETTADAILVKYNSNTRNIKVDKVIDRVGISSHEATHVALRIYQELGQNVTFDSQEPFAYLVEWATECIYKTIRNDKY